MNHTLQSNLLCKVCTKDGVTLTWVGDDGQKGIVRTRCLDCGISLTIDEYPLTLRDATLLFSYWALSRSLVRNDEELRELQKMEKATAIKEGRITPEKLLAHESRVEEVSKRIAAHRASLQSSSSSSGEGKSGGAPVGSEKGSVEGE